MADENSKRKTPLDLSAYNSPYSKKGTPNHPNTDPYVQLRVDALRILEAMGFDADTMGERGVLWAEDQDPFGHVMHSEYIKFMTLCSHRTLESVGESLSEKEYDDMIRGRHVSPVIRRHDLRMYKQVRYPDSLIAANRLDRLEPGRTEGTTCLFSLKQQAIVAEVKTYSTYILVKTGRQVDMRTAGPGWVKLYGDLTKRCERSKMLKDKWNFEHSKTNGPKI